MPAAARKSRCVVIEFRRSLPGPWVPIGSAPLPLRAIVRELVAVGVLGVRLEMADGQVIEVRSGDGPASSWGEGGSAPGPYG